MMAPEEAAADKRDKDPLRTAARAAKKALKATPEWRALQDAERAASKRARSVEDAKMYVRRFEKEERPVSPEDLARFREVASVKGYQAIGADEAERRLADMAAIGAAWARKVFRDLCDSNMQPRAEAAKLLGIPKDAPRKEILAAFRREAKRSHPDAGGSPEAFRRLIAARDALAPDWERAR